MARFNIRCKRCVKQSEKEEQELKGVILPFNGLVVLRQAVAIYTLALSVFRIARMLRWL
jgi:hypothetical protein